MRLCIALCAISLLVAVFGAVVQRRSGPQVQRCNNDNECSPSQCCVEEHRFWIASKREVAKPHPFYTVEDSIPGRCVDYLQRGADCHYMGFASCGCAPHLTCKHYEPDDGPMTKRLVIMKPGYSRCEVEE